MSEDITIERALIEALLGPGMRVREVGDRWYVEPAERTHPCVVWSVPGKGRYRQYGPWRMYPVSDGNMGIGGFDNIIAKLRDPAFRERMNLPPLDESE